MNQAVREAADQGFHGHRNTPFILARIKELTQGNSIPANRALIESNVRMATKVAVELAKLESEFNEPSESTNKPSPEVRNDHVDHTQNIGFPAPDIPENNINEAPQKDRMQEMLDEAYVRFPSSIQLHGNTDLRVQANTKAPHGEVVVFGSVAIDLSCDHSPQTPHSGVFSDSTQVALGGYIPKTSNIATITQSIGGVGHNVALAAQYVRGDLYVKLYSFIGNDP